MCNLEQTKFMVSILNCIGSISDEVTQEIKDLIQIQIDYLINLYT